MPLQPPLWFNLLSFMQGAVSGVSLMIVVGAPFMVELRHYRFRIPTTRRSKVLTTLACGCNALWGLCIVAASWSRSFALAVAFVIVGFLGLLTYMLLFGRAWHRPSARVASTRTRPWQ